MEKPSLTTEEMKIAQSIYSSLNGLAPQRKKEILAYVTTVFREDLRAKIISLQLEAENLSKI